MKKPSSKMPIPFRPNGETVLVKILDVEEKSPGGTIVIVEPDNGSKKTVRAEILALGTKLDHAHEFGLTDKDVSPSFHPKVGDQIMIHRLVGNEILLGGQTFRTVRNEDIVGYYE